MKITFMGAGSTVFAKNVLGDVLLTPALNQNLEISLYDIDGDRLEESRMVIDALNKKYNEGKATINCYLGVENRKDALRGAKFVVNAIQVGLYDPCTIIDFEIPKKYGLRQTIGDTLGIGGIFRGLRTIHVLKDFARDMEEVCPDAYFLNYTNPMAILTGYMQRYTKIKTVGLCHSVQVCTSELFGGFGLDHSMIGSELIAGINHMAWLLKLEDENGNDLYPKIFEKLKNFTPDDDLVRIEMMKRFGYYITESSEHTSEYHPYFIKDKYPEFIDRFQIPLDEYPRRCIEQMKEWETLSKELLNTENIQHERSREYLAAIIEACETDNPYCINGNVINNGYITNLPAKACVEIPIIINKKGLNPCFVGELPEQLAALNNTNIGTQLMTIQAAVSLKKDDIYMAAYLDPHTKDQLSMDEIKNLCDDMIEAHGDWLPKFH